MADNALLPQPMVPDTATYWPGNDTDGVAPYTRSGKTKADLLKTYGRRCRASKNWRAEKYDKTWRRLLDLYAGKQYVGYSQHDRVVVNIAFSTVNTIVPSVAVNEPKVRVTPRDPSHEAGSQKLEAAINYWWRRYKWKLDVKKAVKDSIQIGNGWVKLGWKYEEKERNTTQGERDEQYGQMQQQVEAAAVADPAIAADLPSDDDIYEMIDKKTWEVLHDHPFVQRCSPFDIFIDPEATCEDDLKWIAQKIVAPIERVRGDKRYNRKTRNNLQPDMAQNPRWRDDENDREDRNKQKQNDDIQRVTIWEYWDIEHGYYCVYPDKSDGFLVDPTDNPFPFPHPFVHLGNYEVTDQFYSIGDLEMIEPIQHELNGVRSDMANHRKRWQRAYLALRDKLTPEAMGVLSSNEDGRIVFIEGDEDLTRIVQPVPQTSLDPQMYQYSNQVEADLELVSGITEYQRGSSPEIRRTATEANMIQSNTDARVADKLAQVEEFMSTIAERICQLGQIYLTQEEAAMVLGPDGAQQWETYSKDEIQGEYDFIIEAGSTTPKDDSQLRNDAMQLVQSLQPFMGNVVDPKAVVVYMLQHAFGVQDVSPFLIQQQPQQQPPSQKIIESMSYKDMPPDVQRQMEQQAGFQPSQQGGSSPAEQQQSDQAHEAAMQQMQGAQAVDQSQMDHMEAMQQQQAAGATDIPQAYDQQASADQQAQQDEQQQMMQQLYLQRLMAQQQNQAQQGGP